MTEDTTPLAPTDPDVPAVDEEGNDLPDDVRDGEAAPEDEPAGADADTEVEPSADEDEDEEVTAP